MLKIVCQNFRGPRTKTAALKRSLAQTSDDVVCLTETWLNDGCLDVEFCDWVVYRRDRNYEASLSERGCGSIVTVRNDYNSEWLPDFESHLDRLEDIWVRTSKARNSINSETTNEFDASPIDIKK